MDLNPCGFGAFWFTSLPPWRLFGVDALCLWGVVALRCRRVVGLRPRAFRSLRLQTLSRLVALGLVALRSRGVEALWLCDLVRLLFRSLVVL